MSNLTLAEQLRRRPADAVRVAEAEEGMRHGTALERRAAVLRQEAHDLIDLILKLAQLTAKDRTNAR